MSDCGCCGQINKLNDPEMTRKRTKLSLPAPQVTDAELQVLLWSQLSHCGNARPRNRISLRGDV